MHPNGCYDVNMGRSECAVMACGIDQAKDTFAQSCINGNIPFPDPEEFPECPPGWELASSNSRVGIACPDQVAAATCQASGFTETVCLAAGCTFATGSGGASGGSGSGGSSSGGSSSGNDGTTNDQLCIPVPTATPPSTLATNPTEGTTGPNATLPPFEHIGSGGCPEGFMLEHNNGSLFFECPDTEVCGTSMGCNNFGDCTSSTTCYTPEEKCQAAMTSDKDPTDVIGSCAYWGCSLRQVFIYSRSFCESNGCDGLHRIS